MIRLITIIALILVVGCDVAPVNNRDAKAVACGVLATVSLDAPPMPTPSPAPTPNPAPKPSPGPKKCENCNGTGKVGDGRVFVPCPVCGGDGVK